MARVDSVKEQHNNMLPSVIKSMIIGGVAGYGAKYALPLTKQEKDEAYWKRIAIIKKESKAEKNVFIDEIRKLKNKTPAQDAFIKMVDKVIPDSDIPKTVIVDFVKNEAPKEKAANKATFIAMRKRREFINTLTDEVDKNELKRLIIKANEYMRTATKQHIDFYNKGLKGIRQSTPFVAFGVIVGFVAGVAYNVMKTPLRDNA